jgi:NAD(P)-dependent dehydrogenase (short-subunit alcohol dehydrogenase family)
MSKPLADRIALVTGASRGIGYATGIAIARAAPMSSRSRARVGGLENLDDAIRKLGAALRARHVGRGRVLAMLTRDFHARLNHHG